jgi:hypothetical protein
MPVPFAAGPDLFGGQLITFLLQLRWLENGLNDLTLTRFACAFIEMPLFGNEVQRATHVTLSQSGARPCLRAAGRTLD